MIERRFNITSKAPEFVPPVKEYKAAYKKIEEKMTEIELVEEANRNKDGKNKGKYSINFCNLTKMGVTPRPRFKRYQNAFELLK